MIPNIVMIVSDALRPRDLSLYGYKKETDRNLKRIASESAVFEKNFSTSNASDTSLTSIFSGNFPQTNGFIHQYPRTREEEINKLKKNKFWLPLYLQKRGYETISATPLNFWFKKGFDFYAELGNKKGNKFLNNGIVKRMLLALPGWAYGLGKRLTKIRASPQFYPSSNVVDLAIKKVKEAKRPFFLFAHFIDTHFPFPAAKTTHLKGKITTRVILEKAESDFQKEYIKKRLYDASATSLEEIEKKRDDSTIFMDIQLARLYNFLEKSKILENTIFIFLSDHGENFGEHNIYFCRGGLYDPSVHSVLIIRIPKIKSRRISELTQSIDLTATILDILGEKNVKIDGKSLMKLIKNNEKVRDKVILVDGFCDSRSAVRTKSRKIIHSEGGKCYLCGAMHGEVKEEYDLEQDPEELNRKM